jgi:hypothetical protein
MEFDAPNFKEGFVVLYQSKTDIPAFGARSEKETHFRFL